MSDTQHAFGAGRLRATVRLDGAELCSFHDAVLGELIWPGTAPWPRHSPVLFPIIGRLAGDLARIGDHDYPMTQHGFARDMAFNWVERTDLGCTLVLRDSDASRAGFPYRFSLTLRYTMTERGLQVDYDLHNPDATKTLDASLGTHPAFNWPLVTQSDKQDYFIRFDEDEPAPIRRVHEGLLLAQEFPNPVKDRTIRLDDRLFDNDALIFLNPASHGLDYQSNSGAGLRMNWHGFTSLGIWMKPGAAFLCIEPWQGYSSPAEFSGEFADKPGLLHLAPDEHWRAGWTVETL